MHLESRTIRILPHHYHDDLAFYRGDGSERCLVCGVRDYPSWYVGYRDRLTDEGLPERFAVCSEEHGLVFAGRVLSPVWRT